MGFRGHLDNLCDRLVVSLTPAEYAPYIQCAGHTVTTGEDGIIAHLWDVTATGVRFRRYTTRYQRWCGKTAIFGKWITVWRR